MSHPAYNLAEFRMKFEHTARNVAYLNHAGMTPLSIPAKEAMINAVEVMAGTGSDSYADLQDPTVKLLFDELAILINCTAHEIVLVEGTSFGLNIIAQSLPFQRGDNVLVCDQEFPSNIYAWQNLKSKGVETRIVPSFGGGLTCSVVDKMRSARSKAVAVSAIQFFTGHRTDLYELGEYCRNRNLWLIVDAMQAVGIMPIDVVGMNITALACGGQKALMGPPGQGFFMVRREMIEHMQPVFVGPLSVQNHENWLNYDLTFKSGARRFDMGTIDTVGVCGLLAAVEVIRHFGPENILDWVCHLSDIAIDDLSRRGFAICTPVSNANHAHIVTFAVNNADIMAQRLHDRGIILRSHRDKHGNNYLRISSHGHNTEEEIMRVGQALEELTDE